MRKRNYLMGLVAALAISVAVPAAAHATALSTSLAVQVPQKKQDKKVRGGVGLDVTTNSAHSYPPGTVLQPTSNATVDFDRDFAFSAKGLPTCNPTLLFNTTTEQAKAACPGKRILSKSPGDAILCNATGACGTTPGGATGVVTPFNGVPSGGNLSILLHTRTTANTTTVLSGTLVPSPIGGSFGKRLDVQVPDTTPTGQELTIFHTIIDKIVTSKKKNRNTGKTVKTFFVSAKCSGNKKWDFSAVFTRAHASAGPTTQGATTVTCKKKK